MALNPASGQRDHDVDGTSGCDVSGHQWWTLHSHSLEVLPTGSWRVTATLTTPSGATLVELHLEVDPTAGRRDLLVLRGHGVLDRRAVDPGSPALGVGPRILLELVLHATQCSPHQHLGPSTSHRQRRSVGLGRAAGRMAQKVGDHPGAAASRMRRVRQLAQTTGGRR